MLLGGRHEQGGGFANYIGIPLALPDKSGAAGVNSGSGRSKPSATRSPSAASRSGRKTSRSAAVRNACAGRRRRAANSASPPLGVQMHGRFVEQQQRRSAARLGEQRGMAEDHADQQRLLLAGAGLRGGQPGGGVLQPHVGAVGAEALPPAAASRGARRGQGGAQPILDRQGRAFGQARRRSGRAASGGRPGRGRRRRPAGQRSAVPPARRARPWRRPRGAPSRPPARPARPGRPGRSASRRLRCAIAVSCAATSRACPGSSAQTRRSRKRRRPEAPSWNSRSICGVSQTAVMRDAISAWLRGAAPSRRKTRRSAGPSGGVPVPMSSMPSGRGEAAGDRPGAGGVRARRASSAMRAPRRPRPGTSSEIASSRLVLPLPLAPI